jgi:hypothetical protein
MKTKKFALIFVSIVLVISLNGCGVLYAQPTYTPQPTYTQQPTYTLQPTNTPTPMPVPTMSIPINSSLPKPPSGSPVIDVTFDVQNLPETGVDYSNGKNMYIWSLGTYTARFQAWLTGDNTYVVYSYDQGTFVSFAGKSPAGTGTIGAGVTGTTFDEFAFPLTGSLLPSPGKPVSGYIGSYDAKGDQQGHFQYQPGLATYFQPGFKAGNFLGSSEIFASCGNGKFTWNMKGVSGDITGSRASCSSATLAALSPTPQKATPTMLHITTPVPTLMPTQIPTQSPTRVQSPPAAAPTQPATTTTAPVLTYDPATWFDWLIWWGESNGIFYTPTESPVANGNSGSGANSGGQGEPGTGNNWDGTYIISGATDMITGPNSDGSYCTMGAFFSQSNGSAIQITNNRIENQPIGPNGKVTVTTNSTSGDGTVTIENYSFTKDTSGIAHFTDDITIEVAKNYTCDSSNGGICTNTIAGTCYSSWTGTRSSQAYVPTYTPTATEQPVAGSEWDGEYKVTAATVNCGTATLQDMGGLSAGQGFQVEGNQLMMSGGTSFDELDSSGHYSDSFTDVGLTSTTDIQFTKEPNGTIQAVFNFKVSGNDFPCTASFTAVQTSSFNPK